MKKTMAMVLALFFMSATSGLVWALKPSATPVNKSTKHGRLKHHSKKNNKNGSSKSEKTTN